MTEALKVNPLGKTWRHDVLAGLAVFFIAVPLSLGIAHASGAPLLSGIVSAVIGGLIAGALSGGQLAISGPAAGLSSVVLWGIMTLGSFEAFLVAVFLAGLLQIAMAFGQAGVVAKMMPASVVRGMIAAIGVLLIVKQFPHMVGYDLETFGVEDFEAEEHNSVGNFIDAFSLFNRAAFVIGVLSFLFLFAWDRFAKRMKEIVPGAVFVVVLGIGGEALVASVWPDYALSPEHMVSVPHLSGLHSFLAATTLPDFAALLRFKTYYVAIVLALVASLETLLATDAIDRIDPWRRKTRASRELVAQGIGNAVNGLVGGLPITAVVARSTVNISAGGRTKKSAIIAGVLMAAAMLLAEPLMNRVPLATLAAVLVYVGLRLIDPGQLKQMAKKGAAVSVPFFVTLIAIVVTNLLAGVLIGLLSAAVFILAGLYKTANFQIESDGRMTRIKLGEDVTFFHKAQLEAALDAVPNDRVVYIDGSRSLMVDDDIIDTLERYRARAGQRGIQVIIGGIGRISSYTQEFTHRMDEEYAKLISNNREWVKERLHEDPTFFSKSSEGQAPHFLYIGCSDSRVPAETVTKTDPGNLFVHRNIANLVSLADVNMLSVLQYSVDVLNVPHIIVCGHYRCGGVRAALSHKSFGLIDNWITPIKQVVQQNSAELEQIKDPVQYERRVIELHVIQQVRNLYKTSVVQNAIKKFGSPKVHGWVYDLETGLINDLDVTPGPGMALHPIFQFEK